MPCVNKGMCPPAYSPRSLREGQVAPRSLGTALQGSVLRLNTPSTPESAAPRAAGGPRKSLNARHAQRGAGKGGEVLGPGPSTGRALNPRFHVKEGGL